MMITIGFVRHGVTAWNKEGRAQGSTDIPLDEEGIYMGEQVAERLATEQWDAIYTSPLLRAKKTAEIIAEKIPTIKLYLEDRLRETGGGQTEGMTMEERVANWGSAWRELDLGQEPHELVIARGMALIEELKTKHSNQKILIVSHGSFIGKILAELVSTEEFNSNLGNTSVSIVKLQEETNYCELYNCVKHLEAKEF